LGGAGAELRSSARLSLAYALTCCSTAAGASIQKFIEHALGALTSVLALDDAHPFRAQAVATLGANTFSRGFARGRRLTRQNTVCGVGVCGCGVLQRRPWQRRASGA
jgi:predicted alpha/beta hydrolase